MDLGFFYDFEVHLFPNSVLVNVDVYHTLNVTWIYNHTLRLKMAVALKEISSFEPCENPFVLPLI